ncbi:hypothetical protein Rxycam_01711 [Rubrobacter xylanophilus DSM 9941]|nr:hypothetical protein Rxycam_01711 [Rubrobacter xylanophilus DSM 9941]
MIYGGSAVARDSGLGGREGLSCRAYKEDA